MTIEWFRDLVVSIFGLIASAVLIFFAVLAYSLYKRTKIILNAVKSSPKKTQGISSLQEDEIIKSIIQIAALIQGIRQGINTVNKLFKKEKGEKHV